MHTQYQNKRELDKINHSILHVLREKGRTSFAELSERVGPSITSCTECVRHLEREGLIVGYHARLSP